MDKKIDIIEDIKKQHETVFKKYIKIFTIFLLLTIFIYLINKTFMIIIYFALIIILFMYLSEITKILKKLENKEIQNYNEFYNKLKEYKEDLEFLKAVILVIILYLIVTEFILLCKYFYSNKFLIDIQTFILI